MKKFVLKLRKRNIDKSEMLGDLQRVAQELALSSVTADQYTAKGKFGVNTFLRKFGSWNNSLKEANLEIPNRQNISLEELFENLAMVWEKLGHQPLGREMEKPLGHSNFAIGTYEKRFGTWNKALEAFIEYVENPESKSESEDKIKKSACTKVNPKRTSKKINWRLRAIVLIRDGCICKMCGASPTKDSSVVLHVDHIKPWSKGGETEMENLQTLCAVCNIGKSDEEF